MTMPKFEPVIHYWKSVTDGIPSQYSSLPGPHPLYEVTAYYNADQLTAAYEAGKQEAEAENMNLTLLLKVTDETLFLLYRKFPEVKAAIDAAAKEASN